MLTKGFFLQDFRLAVIHFLEFAVILHLCLHHPNVQILGPSAQPVTHSFLQFRVIVTQQIRALLPPSQHSSEVVPSSKWDDGDGYSRVIDLKVGKFGDYPHNRSISSANYQNNGSAICYKGGKLLKARVPLLLIAHIVEIDLYGDEIIRVGRSLRSGDDKAEFGGLGRTRDTLESRSYLPTPPPEPEFMNKKT